MDEAIRMGELNRWHRILRAMIVLSLRFGDQTPLQSYLSTLQDKGFVS